MSVRALSILLLVGLVVPPLRGAPPPSLDLPSFVVTPLHGTVKDGVDDGGKSPESAFVAFCQRVARGERGSWRNRSIPRLRPHLPAEATPPLPLTEPERRSWEDCELLELRRFGTDQACALGRRRRADGTSIIEARMLQRIDGSWLNAGSSSFESLVQARAAYAARCARSLGGRLAPPLPGDKGSQERLDGLIAFLREKARPPEALLGSALGKHALVLVGECHHRPRYWNFLTEWIRRNEGNCPLGSLYLELPSHGQAWLDRFLASSDGDPTPVLRLLQDVLVFGWPDQALLDFLQALRIVNLRRPPERRIRCRCVDMPRPWARIRNVKDWQRYDRDRHRYMAETILADRRGRPKDEHGLAVLGALHVLDHARHFEGSVLPTTAWWLRQELGEGAVFTVFSHMPILPNMGAARGRLRGGLFDEAFLGHENRPVAFLLKGSPFGREPFDAFPDEPCRVDWGEAYDAYLYLGRLDDELHSPLIAGFYDEPFYREIERRHELTYGRSWWKTVGCRSSAGSFRSWMGLRWGRARFSPRALASMKRWRQDPQ